MNKVAQISEIRPTSAIEAPDLTVKAREVFGVDIDMEVEDAKHATAIMAALRTNPSVDTVERARG